RKIFSSFGKSCFLTPDPLLTFQVGDTVTLRCFYTKNIPSYMSWYKQSGGWKPRLISTNEEEINHLIISNTQDSDSAMYYCGATSLHIVHFGNGTLLVTGMPVSDTVQPGDSVSLQCTIETGSCAGEHSVYWFRHGSGESLPGVIYTHGNRSDECEKSPEAGSPTRSCVYSLPKRNLSLSDAGTYYCAVAMCGEILFGNGNCLEMLVNKKKVVTLYLKYSIIPGIILVALRCTFSKAAMSFLRNGDQTCTQYSRWGLTKELYNCSITSLDLNSTHLEI
uniref:Ig-like domain-containing protein n=1 Tax=Paramormyrops kingsleyae TaxID=1676925 RepID=A0A3B3S8C3_9TELE